jgi:hypothetical protein
MEEWKNGRVEGAEEFDLRQRTDRPGTHHEHSWRICRAKPSVGRASRRAVPSLKTHNATRREARPTDEALPGDAERGQGRFGHY